MGVCLVGLLMPVRLNLGFGAKNFVSKEQARTKARMSPYQMNRGTEGEMWLGQRENIFRQDLDFSKREAANKLSIRQGLQGDELAMRRRSDYFDAATARGVSSSIRIPVIKDWNESGVATGYRRSGRRRLPCPYAGPVPGASTWDLLSGGSASGAGPGAVPGLPGMPSPSMGTGRSGPDPSVAMAKIQADSQAMQTIAQAKIAGAQMRVQEGIAKREALISFMNTAIQGAKTPSEIMARASAAKLATKQAETEDWRPGVLHQQAGDLAASADLKYAQRAKTLIDAENARTGTVVNKLRNNAGDLYDYLKTVVPQAQLELQKLFRRQSIR